MSTSAVASAFGWSRQPRSVGNMESNSGRRGVSGGPDRLNRLLCSKMDSAVRVLLHSTFATRNPLNRLAWNSPSEVLTKRKGKGELIDVKGFAGKKTAVYISTDRGPTTTRRL